MASDIEVSSKYGGLHLICNEDAFARISGHILAEPSIAVAIGSSAKGRGVRFITVGMPPVKDTSRLPFWLALIPMIVASGLSGGNC